MAELLVCTSICFNDTFFRHDQFSNGVFCKHKNSQKVMEQSPVSEILTSDTVIRCSKFETVIVSAQSC